MSQIKTSFGIKLSQIIDSQIVLFIDKIVQKCNLDKDELFALWKEDSSKESSKESSIKVNNIKKEKKIENICIYIDSISGSKCTTRIRGEGNLCSKHKTKAKKINKEEIKPENNCINKSKILRLHRTFKKFYHPETGFVFKSKEEKVVIGKIEGENIEKLNSKSIDECKAWGFPYIEIEESYGNDESKED